MKNKLNSSVVIVFLLTLIGCSDITPNDYEKEVEDNVKCAIALADFIVEISQEDPKLHLQASLMGLSENKKLSNVIVGISSGDIDLEDFGNSIDETYKVSKKSYKEVLKNATTWTEPEYYDEIAKQVLKHYSELDIKVSDYKEIKNNDKEQIWSFKELQTGIEFIFTYDKNKNGYSVEPLQNSWMNYIEKYTAN